MSPGRKRPLVPLLTAVLLKEVTISGSNASVASVITPGKLTSALVERTRRVAVVEPNGSGTFGLMLSMSRPRVLTHAPSRPFNSLLAWDPVAPGTVTELFQTSPTGLRSLNTADRDAVLRPNSSELPPSDWPRSPSYTTRPRFVLTTPEIGVKKPEMLMSLNAGVPLPSWNPSNTDRLRKVPVAVFWYTTTSDQPDHCPPPGVWAMLPMA